MEDRSTVPYSSIIASEAVQRRSWRMLSCAASLPMAEALGIRSSEVGSTLYQGALKVPGAQFNKVFSFGIDEDFTSETMEAAADWLRRSCAQPALLMVPPSEREQDNQDRLLRHGFRRIPMDITVFHMDADATPEFSRPSDIDVRSVTIEQAELFGQVLSDGLDTPAASAWLTAFAVGQPAVRPYLAYEGPTAIGAAALLVDGEWGWLFLAAVRPAFRNRGAQTALLARRIQDGRKAGVRTFNVATLRPAPGYSDVFASYRNMLQIGFKVAYNRPNYVLSAREAGGS